MPCQRSCEHLPVRRDDSAVTESAPRAFLGVGTALVLGFCCATVAALYPGLSSIWTAGGGRAVQLIADRESAWEIANWMFTIGIGATLAGLVMLAHILDRASPGSAIPAVATAFAVVGSVVWVANLAYRLTVTVRVADRGNVPDWYSDVTGWADAGLLGAAGLLFGVALLLFGVIIVVSRVLSRWTGWFAGVVGLFLVGQFVVSHDVVPALIYLAPLPAGVAALIRGTPSGAGISVSFDQRQH